MTVLAIRYVAFADSYKRASNVGRYAWKPTAASSSIKRDASHSSSAPRAYNHKGQKGR